MTGARHDCPRRGPARDACCRRLLMLAEAFMDDPVRQRAALEEEIERNLDLPPDLRDALVDDLLLIAMRPE